MSSDEKVIPNGSPTSVVARRSFLQVLGAAFSVAVLPEMVTACAENGGEVFSVGDTEALTASSTITVVRPQDLLVLSIGFVNLKHNAIAGTLVKLSSAAPAQIILDFPPQAIIEDAVNLTTGTTGSNDSISSTYPSPNNTPLAGSMLGGPSRLVFQVPSPYTPVPYTLSSILGLCASSSLVLTPTMQSSLALAVPAVAPNPTSGDPLIDRMLAASLAPVDPAASGRDAAFHNELPPANLGAFLGTGVTAAGGTPPAGLADNSVTQIEIPFRLKLSPNSQAGWSHATTPVQGHTKAYEVWHTVLGVRSVGPTTAGTADERNSYLRTARALWTRDWDLVNVKDTVGIINPSLTPAQREDIVVNSSSAQNARPIQVNRLMLSSLGGYLDARGDWPGSDVQRWVHKMTGGRENFVEVDTPGYLLPFGNSATSLQITRRNDNPKLGPVGELYSFNLIIIGNPVTSYRNTAGLSPTTQAALLRWPFLSVELKKTRFITQRVTPGTAMWPVDPSGTPIMVPAVGYDRRGRAIEFSVPLFFSPQNIGATNALNAYYAQIQSPPTALPRTAGVPAVGSYPVATNPYRINPNLGVATPSLDVPMSGQRIAYADSKTTSGGAPAATAAPPKDDTTFATQTLSFDVLAVTDSFQQPTTTTPQFVPAVTAASIYAEALHQYLQNQPDGTMPPVNVWYHGRFVAAPGFDALKNRSQLLFQLASSLTADFTKDPSGGDRSDGGTGFIAPNMTFNALSRKTGPAYDGSVVQTTSPTAGQRGMVPLGGNPFTDGAFDPKTYLGMAESALGDIKIFGVFSILDIIKAVDPGDADKDLAGLVSSAEEAALKYAPKFIAQGLSDLEKIISLIAEVKSQVELLYTNAQELLGPDYAGGLPTGTLAQLSNISLNQVVVAGENAAQSVIDSVKTQIAQQVAPIIAAAKAFYGADSSSGLQATVGAIENLDLKTLIGDASTKGSIIELLTNADALVQAVANLAKLGARATILGQPIAVNGSTAVKDAAATVGNVANAALQIATGIQQSFGTKLQELMDILGVVEGIHPSSDAINTKFGTLFAVAEQALDAVRDMTVKIEWQPKVGSFGVDGWTIFRPATQHALTLTMKVAAKATAAQPAGVDLSCRLDHFDICIGQTDDGKGGSTGVVSLGFDHISFEMLVGKKPDVDVKINGITFGGPLAFLETLKKLIPMDGFSDPPYVNITTDGIKAGFSLAIPNIAVGMFSLENLSISAELDIPFFSSGSKGAALTFTFSFCDKDHPFIITVSLLGGGGYFVVSFTPKGLQHLEASISVGAQLALNLLDVAQGSVSIMAGITFTIDNSSGTDDVSLTAFLRLHGELDILGIITISVDLSVSMTYDIKNHIIIAEAKVKVDVSIIFFSINVELPFRKEFHSCNNDPTLRQLMPPNPGNVASDYWVEYCNAYV